MAGDLLCSSLSHGSRYREVTAALHIEVAAAPNIEVTAALHIEVTAASNIEVTAALHMESRQLLQYSIVWYGIV